MELVRWEPFRELTRIRDEMDRLFGQLTGVPAVPKNGDWMPTVDVYEEEKELVVKVDLPGVKKEDVHITATEDALMIEGKTETETEEKKDNYFARERRYGSFMRRIPMPVTVNAEKAAATFDNGMVTIKLPKVEEKPKVRKIEIR